MTRSEVEAGISQHRELATKASLRFKATGDAAWKRALDHHTKWIGKLEAELQTYD